MLCDILLRFFFFCASKILQSFPKTFIIAGRNSTYAEENFSRSQGFFDRLAGASGSRIGSQLDGSVISQMFFKGTSSCLP